MRIFAFNSSPILPSRPNEKVVCNSCIQHLSLAFRIGLGAKSIETLSVCLVTSSACYKNSLLNDCTG